jgi:hypothetical protein
MDTEKYFDERHEIFLLKLKDLNKLKEWMPLVCSKYVQFMNDLILVVLLTLILILFGVQEYLLKLKYLCGWLEDKKNINE